LAVTQSLLALEVQVAQIVLVLREWEVIPLFTDWKHLAAAVAVALALSLTTHWHQQLAGREAVAMHGSRPALAQAAPRHREMQAALDPLEPTVRAAAAAEALALLAEMGQVLLPALVVLGNKH
jgi:hypothetical protein